MLISNMVMVMVVIVWWLNLQLPICNRCPSPLMLWVRFPLRCGELDTTLCDTVYHWLLAGRWFPPPIKLTTMV